MVGVRPFKFEGALPASKSILNRLLVIGSFADPGTFHIDGDSAADDVQHMRDGLDRMRARAEVDCGAAGAVLRFLALRASRMPGRHDLRGTRHLLRRPLKPLVEILQQLGAEVSQTEGTSPGLVIHAPRAWHLDNPIVTDLSVSSQFASGLLLSAWDLPEPLVIKFAGEPVSRGYLDMTIALARRAGLSIRSLPRGLAIAPGRRVKPGRHRAEIDLSSAFAVAAAALVSGEAVIKRFPVKSLQPDRVFVDVLEAMGAPVRLTGSVLHVERTERLRPVDWDLKDCPDLFPVLSVLCGLAEGKSRLFGAPHLSRKESNRIAKSADLLRRMQRPVEELPDGLAIEGGGFRLHNQGFEFSPAKDHRLAMAAAVARKAGFPMRIKDRGVVAKSFPGFWRRIGERE